MNYQELQAILRQNRVGGVMQPPKSLSLQDVISGIQSQYTQPQSSFQSIPSMIQQMQRQQPSGAGRFVNPSQTFGQPSFTPASQQAQNFMPGEFDLEAYKNADPAKLSALVNLNSGDSYGSGDSGSTSTATDADGLATGANIGTGAVTLGGMALGALTGLPIGLVSSIAGKQNIANAINAQSAAQAAAQNQATVAGMMGIANTPENQATIASAIDSITAINATQNPAISQAQAAQGSQGVTGAQAAAIGQAAGNAATEAGYSPSAIGQAQQTGVNAALMGMTEAQALNAALMGPPTAENAQSIADSFSGGSYTDGGYTGGYESAPGTDSGTSSAMSGGFGDSGSSGGGSSKIVCTAMNQSYGFGSFRNRIWLKYAVDHMTKAHEVGYHTLFLPLVNLAYKQDVKPLRVVLENIARHRSADLRAEMRGSKRDNIGRAYRAILEPLCYTVGKIKGY